MGKAYIISGILGVGTALTVLLAIYGSRRAMKFLGADKEDYVRPDPWPLIPITYGIEEGLRTNGQKWNPLPEQVHVSLAGTNRIGVSFITDDYNLPSVVEWGMQPENYTWQAQGTATSYKFINYKSGLIHFVILGAEVPLEPRRTYYYRCARVGNEYSFTTPPALGSDVPINFGLLGDLGQTQWSKSTLSHLSEASVDVVLLAGDLSYADSYQPRWDSWGRLIEPHAGSVPWMVVGGNHEKEGLFGFEPKFKSYNARWPMPYRESGSTSNLYYSFEVAGVHLVMLGSYTDYGAGSDQFKWLQADLAAVNRTRTPWLIAVMHAPWYSSNYAHQGEGEYMRKAMEHLLHGAKVDMVFTGHVHAYERTKPIYKWKPRRCGTTYIIVGDGGNREGLARGYVSPQPKWSAKREPSFGFGLLRMLNATHAQWFWHRNQDPDTVLGDETWIQTMGDPNHPCNIR